MEKFQTCHLVIGIIHGSEFCILILLFLVPGFPQMSGYFGCLTIRIRLGAGHIAGEFQSAGYSKYRKLSWQSTTYCSSSRIQHTHSFTHTPGVHSLFLYLAFTSDQGQMQAGSESEERIDLGNLILIYLRNAMFDFTFRTQIHILLDIWDLF